MEQRPVTETLAQVESSGFLDRITRRSGVNADGNKAWKSAAASRGIPFQNVIHQVKNFTSDCPKVWPEVSTVAGTQTLDPIMAESKDVSAKRDDCETENPRT